MATMSLSELRAQNAQEDKDQEVIEDPADTEIDDVPEVDDQTDDVEEPEDDDVDDVDDLDREDEEDDIPAWQSGDSKSVPLSKHIQLRQKLKHERNDALSEAEELRKEIEELKRAQGLKQEQHKAEPELTAPDVKDFTDEYGDIDFNKLNAANAQYMQKLVESRLSGNEQKQRQQAEAAKREQLINKHYERAQSLIDKGSVKAEDYANADRRIVDRFDSFQPGKGRELADMMIGYVNDVSDEPEKLWFKLGVDSKALSEVIDGFAHDKSGAKGVLKLSEINHSISTKKTRLSKAPAPAKQVKGDKKAAASASQLHKQYVKASKSGDTQKAYTLSRQAKKAGIDTTKW